MKNQRISALMLAVTPTFKHIAALLTAATGIEYFLFHRAMKAAQPSVMTEFTDLEPIPAFEAIIENAHLEYILCALFFLFSALFLYTGCEQKGGKLRYTLRRLSVPEGQIHLSWAVYYSLCYLLLMVWQAGMFWVLYHVYAASPFGEGLGANGFFLATYRSDLLHSLLPLHDVARQIRNAVLLPCLGLSCSFFSFHLSRGRRGWDALLLVGMTAFVFIRSMGNTAMDVFTMIYAVWMTAICLRHTRRDSDEA